MGKKYICLHGHFYQPPRENAWLESIELQESAAPYHDWNDRITDECYSPNAVSRILNDQGKIVNIVNNLSRISHNFGPTLLSWMERYHPITYRRIIDSDKAYQDNNHDSGPAIAQVYNHIIMPLANRRDKETQVSWGIQDFKKRYNRQPRGMWLAETAVDTETLEVLSDYGIDYTILAPSQADSFRKIGEEKWTDGIDPSKAYVCNLPNGKSINLFFYFGELSQKIAFGGLLKNGKDFAQSLIGAFRKNDDDVQLVHVATDGETFGHHHRFGDMALAYCINYIDQLEDIELVNYAEFLEKHPPAHEVRIKENTSWSCAHGVERWQSDCGCSTGGQAGWNQQWRQPLRKAVDDLRDALVQLFEEKLAPYQVDIWKLRNQYIDIFTRRSEGNINTFLESNFGQISSKQERINIIRLFEMQKQCLYMYTSCGWFFNDISGIETVQILQYACRAIQLAELVSDQNYERTFLGILSQAHSNYTSRGSGQDLYYKEVATKKLTLPQVGMHYAVHALFSEQEDFDVLNYKCKGHDLKHLKAGGYRVVMGGVEVDSLVTLSSQKLHYLLIHLTNHHLIGNCSIDIGQEKFEGLTRDVETAFQDGNLAAIMDILQMYFKTKSFSFHDLFKDEQLKLLDRAINRNIEHVRHEYEGINARMYGLMNQMRKNKLKVPLFFIKNMAALTSIKLEQIFKVDFDLPLPKDTLNSLIKETRRWQLNIDTERLKFLATRRINHMALRLSTLEQEKMLEDVDEILFFLKVKEDLSIEPYLHELQNTIFHLVMSDKLDKNDIPELIEKLNLDFN